MHIRAATAADLAALAAIEAVCNPAPWTEAAFQAALAAPNQHILVGEIQNHSVALMVWQEVADEAELFLLDTLPPFRRQGLAGALLQVLLDTATAAVIFLEVRASNIAAQTLYRRSGFQECGRRRDYYPTASGREDALLMEWRRG